MGFRAFCIWLGILGLAIGPALAASEDSDGGASSEGSGKNARPEVLRELEIPPAPVVSPEASLEKMKVAPGFRVELVAAEPMIHDPVEMRFDAAGRLWVVEMRSYMPNPEGEGEDAPTSRVVVLEDTDGDGRMNESTVFLDGLVLPRAIAMVEGGVLIAEPPKLWYAKDTDGDLRCDEKEIVYEGYAEHGHATRTENGLLRALDNWRYNAASATRYRFEGGAVTAEPTARRGDWGIAQDSYGRLFTCTNSSWLHADYLPAEYLLRHPHFETTAGVYEKVVKDQAVWPIRINPGVNRGYREGALRPDGRLAHTTSACGPAIYRGDRYPARYRGNAFVAEPAGNCVARFSLQGSGIAPRPEHETYEDPEWDRREFLASTDERFRPVNLHSGPDGCLYVVDFYRGIIEYKRFITPFLRGQIERRDLANPLGHGRIYRIVPKDEGDGADEEREAYERPRLDEASSRVLVNRLSHPNGWWRDTAQRLLVQREDPEAVEPLRSLAANGSDHLGRLHALWTLEGLGALDRATVQAALSDPHPKVRAAAVRTGEALLGTEAEAGFASKLVEMIEDPSPHVRAQLMLSLGELKKRPEAVAAMATLLGRHLGNRYLRHAALSGLAGREVQFAVALLRKPGLAEASSGGRAVLRELGSIVFRGRGPERITALLRLAAEQPEEQRWRQLALLDGLVEAEDDPKPIEMDAAPEALEQLAAAEHEAVRERAGKLRNLLKAPDAAAPDDGDDEPMPLTEAQQTRYAQGKALYQAVCMACHQAHGKGQPGMAPSLRGTPWVEGPEEQLVRIVLDGLEGPIVVDGEKWNLVMPGHRESPILSDERIAAILTYVRRTWGNEASPVEPDTVQRIREATADRRRPWTAEELEALEPKNQDGE